MSFSAEVWDHGCWFGGTSLLWDIPNAQWIWHPHIIYVRVSWTWEGCFPGSRVCLVGCIAVLTPMLRCKICYPKWPKIMWWFGCAGGKSSFFKRCRVVVTTTGQKGQSFGGLQIVLISWPCWSHAAELNAQKGHVPNSSDSTLAYFWNAHLHCQRMPKVSKGVSIGSDRYHQIFLQISF